MIAVQPHRHECRCHNVRLLCPAWGRRFPCLKQLWFSARAGESPAPRSSTTVFALVFLLTLCSLGCQSRAVVESAAPAPAAAKAETPDTIELDEAMMPNIAVEQVRQQISHRMLTATGKIQVNEDRTARVLAPLAGQVMGLQLRVGDPVQKDQVLFSIKSREVAALITDYRESQRDQDLAEKTHAMTKDLFEHQAASRIALQQAEGDLAKAKSHVARAEEGLRVLGLDLNEIQRTGGLQAMVPVIAPLSGAVMERNVTNGQYVQADSNPLLTIADLGTVWVLVDIFERDIHVVHPGQKVQVAAAAWPDRRFTATVERISDRVDPESRTLKVRLLVSNPGLLLKPEMFITASVELSETTAGIPIPSTALFTEDGKSYLFVALEGRRFERRMVSAAPGGEGHWSVTSGLRTGDRIVSNGALLLNYRRVQKQE